MLKPIQFAVGIILLILMEVLRVYFIMPFPGSQHTENIILAYFLNENIFWFRFVGLLIILFPSVSFFSLGNRKTKIIVGLAIAFYGIIFYLFNFKFVADKIFYQPESVTFKGKSDNKIPMSNLILGVGVDGEYKAYPIQLIGYHHQVRDEIKNVPVMITYCTVCRTGRAYQPMVNGKKDDFRLVGMDQFNAMFEDASTGSWWRQVNGEAVAGPLKGSVLPEIYSEQMTLESWLGLHPESMILQPDSAFADAYERMKPFDKGRSQSALTKRDSLSWKEKSWVVGVQIGMSARAYDWNEMVKQKIVNDTLNNVPIAIVVEPDSASFHVFERDSLEFISNVTGLKDKQTSSRWSWNGKGISGSLEGQQMKRIQAYQEFWHSWQTFHPQTTRFESGAQKSME
jgi:hypothetical protein